MNRLINLFLKWFLPVVLMTVVLTTVLLFFLTRSADKVIAQWSAPKAILYDGGAYYLSVVEAEIDWSMFPLGMERNYYIYAGRDQGKPSYGHTLNFSFYPDSIPIEDHIKASKVEWSAEGVTFIAASGHKVFIPQEMFTGGR